MEAGIHSVPTAILLGVGSETVSHNAEINEDVFWKQLEDADRRDYMMLASSRGAGEVENESGIYGGHGYTVLAVKEVHAHGQRHRLLQLRNPWGDSEWKGDWSDHSHLWTP